MTISGLEGCPKCKGFLMLEKDTHGLYEQCLQCGYTHDLPKADKPSVKQVEHKEEVAASWGASLNGSNDFPQTIPQPPEYYALQTIPASTNWRFILNYLHERHWGEP